MPVSYTRFYNTGGGEEKVQKRNHDTDHGVLVQKGKHTALTKALIVGRTSG